MRKLFSTVSAYVLFLCALFLFLQFQYSIISKTVFFKSTFFLCKRIISWIELPWPENPANTYARHTETLDSCFDLIRSHQQCILWSPPLEIKPATTDFRAETLQLSYQYLSHTSDAKLTRHGNCAGFSGHGNSIHNITPQLKKENIHLYPCSWDHNNHADAYFLSSWEDVALEVTVSSVKSTDVTCRTHSG